MLTRRAMLWTAACLAVAPSAAAQGPGRRGPRGGAMDGEQYLEMLKERLNLTAEQEEKLKTVFEEQRKKMQQAREEAGGDFSAMRETISKLRAETDEKVTAVLDDQQKKEYEKLQEELRSQMEERRGGRRRRRQQ